MTKFPYGRQRKSSQRSHHLTFVLVALTFVVSACNLGGPDVTEDTIRPFSFAVACDMRQYSGDGSYDGPSYFRGVCEAIAGIDPGAFMVSPGDCDPPGDARWTLDEVLGEAYMWYPVVGNHEAETPSDMEYLRTYDYEANGMALPNVVDSGPSGSEWTTYSFDYANAHFVVLNEYYDGTSDTGTDGDVVDELYAWLAADLAATTKEHIFVFGHEPAYPQPDADNGRERHMSDSLNKYAAHRDRFWDLLAAHDVVAYVNGHTHNYSAVKIGGVWQIDVGHCRGAGDTGAPSTFVLFHVDGPTVEFVAYRDEHDGVYDYDDILHQGVLRH